MEIEFRTANVLVSSLCNFVYVSDNARRDYLKLKENKA